VWIGIKNRSIKHGLVLWPKVVQQLTGSEKWLKNVDLSAVGHALYQVHAPVMTSSEWRSGMAGVVEMSPDMFTVK